MEKQKRSDNNDHFKRGLEITIKKDGLKISVVDNSLYNCMEVDFKESPKAANNLFQE